MKKFLPRLILLGIRCSMLGVGCWMLSASAADMPAPTAATSSALTPIDRHALVTRHNPVLTKLDSGSPLSVGNGEFCFTADVTGLQSFPEAYAGNDDIPLCTMADWGWHSFPNPQGFSMDTFAYKNYDSHGRMVGYADEIKNGANSASSTYLRENPHKFNLIQLGFALYKRPANDAPGPHPAQPVAASDLTDIKQTLDMWNGVLTSQFKIQGNPVTVQTICHPDLDLIAVRVESALVATGDIAVNLRFPYASIGKNGSDWTKPAAHTSTLKKTSETTVQISRQLDNTTYNVSMAWTAGANFSPTTPHQFVLVTPEYENVFEFVCSFSQKPSSAPLPTFAETKAAAQKHWNQFWSTGGAIDLSLSKDPRWQELERRIVLSEYLTAIQSAGKNPPAETGLTMNSWYGRFHMEMYWWHDAHFALWGRAPLLENSLDFYQRAMPQAIANAKRQGYAGARWPKMSEPSGADSPSSVGAFLIWQQPHPIYLAELDYRAHPDKATLEKYKDVIFATADFMASFAWWDEAGQRYVLGPPLQAAQERFDKATMINPTYELTYWRFGLETAQQWRVRLGLARNETWDKVLQKLSKPLVVDGKYAFTESTPDSYANPKWNDDHPAVVDAFGVLPGPGLDVATMKNTFDWVFANWKWSATWGWDYPALAMCAARVGEPEQAINALLIDTDKNHYLANGHNFQRGGTNDTTLPLYLPSNGGLLTAVAMMAAGWDGAPQRNAPGFPDNGQWVVRWEGLKPLP